MADLLDIAPSTAVDTVLIDGGQPVDVRGISIDAMAALIARFPNMKDLANGGFGEDVFLRLVQGFGAAVCSIIAAGCGHLGDERYERRAGQLSPEDALNLLKAISGLTFPNGIGSFVEKVTVLINGVNEGAAKPPMYKMRSKQSPSMSPLSPDAAGSPPTMQ